MKHYTSTDLRNTEDILFHAEQRARCALVDAAYHIETLEADNAALRESLEDERDERQRAYTVVLQQNAALRENLGEALKVVRRGRSDAAAFVSEANRVLALASQPEVKP